MPGPVQQWRLQGNASWREASLWDWRSEWRGVMFPAIRPVNGETQGDFAAALIQVKRDRRSRRQTMRGCAQPACL